MNVPPSQPCGTPPSRKETLSPLADWGDGKERDGFWKTSDRIERVQIAPPVIFSNMTAADCGSRNNTPPPRQNLVEPRKTKLLINHWIHPKIKQIDKIEPVHFPNSHKEIGFGRNCNRFFWKMLEDEKIGTSDNPPNFQTLVPQESTRVTRDWETCVRVYRSLAHSDVGSSLLLGPWGCGYVATRVPLSGGLCYSLG